MDWVEVWRASFFSVLRWRPAKFLGLGVGRLAKELAQLADAGPVAQNGALGQGQEAEVVEEAI